MKAVFQFKNRLLNWTFFASYTCMLYVHTVNKYRVLIAITLLHRYLIAPIGILYSEALEICNKYPGTVNKLLFISQATTVFLWIIRLFIHKETIVSSSRPHSLPELLMEMTFIVYCCLTFPPCFTTSSTFFSLSTDLLIYTMSISN